MKKLRLLLSILLVAAFMGKAQDNQIGNIDESLTTSLISGKKIGEIAIAGRLFTEIHALFMVATNENNTVLNWFNLGYSGGGIHNEVGGNFGNFGLDVPWSERDLKYPSLDAVAGHPAVFFNGNNFMKSNYVAESEITGSNSLSIEMWIHDKNPKEGEVILGWQSRNGSSTSSPVKWPAGIQSDDQWHHLVVTCTKDTEIWYFDGKNILETSRKMFISPDHQMVLGGASQTVPSFNGSLLTLRVHKDVLNPDQVSHNYHGGGMLGTSLKYNLDPNVKPEEGYHYDTWSASDPDSFFYAESEHFDHRVKLERITKMEPEARADFYKRIPSMFELAEACYENYSKVHALRMPIVSAVAKYRGDGIKYRIKIGTTDGANYMGWHGELGFGYAMQFPGYFNPHEFVHGTQAQTGGELQGNYWEVHANWPQTYLGIHQTIPSFIETRDQNLFEASGRSYYHARLMLHHLAETSEYGPMFISKLWYDGQKDIYPWEAFKSFDPDPATSLGYEWARMVQRNITWDYKIHEPFDKEEKYNPDIFRDDVRKNYEIILSQGYILPEKITDEPGWYRAPKAKIPQQTGWNIIPLKAEKETVRISLDGYINPDRGSAWYGGLVAIDENGQSRYSDIVSTGETLTFKLKRTEQELYFIVVAIPDHIMAIDMVGDVKAPEQEPYPYKVKFDGADPIDKMARHYSHKYKDLNGHSHPNGGGFVDERSVVSPTAYIGPDAFVIGESKVLDFARVEDYGVVENSTLSGHAIISGHGMVTGKSVVADYARVRDYGRIENMSVLSGCAKIAEYATLSSGKEKSNKGHSTLKGIAIQYGGNVSGSAMIDHHYAKGQDITRGKWFSWSWGSGKNPGEFDEDFNGLYAQMSFEKEHPFMAWDDFGITWGYLNNGATTVSVPGKGKALLLDGLNQYVELPGDVSDQIEMSLLFDVKWYGGDKNQPVFYFGNAAGSYVYFTPSDEDGKASLIMEYNGSTERISDMNAFPMNKWVKIGIYSGMSGTKLSVNDKLIGQNSNMHIQNLTKGAGRFFNYIGRNIDGSTYYNGMLDNFEVYNVLRK